MRQRLKFRPAGHGLKGDEKSVHFLSSCDLSVTFHWKVFLDEGILSFCIHTFMHVCMDVKKKFFLTIDSWESFVALSHDFSFCPFQSWLKRFRSHFGSSHFGSSQGSFEFHFCLYTVHER